MLRGPVSYSGPYPPLLGGGSIHSTASRHITAGRSEVMPRTRSHATKWFPGIGRPDVMLVLAELEQDEDGYVVFWCPPIWDTNKAPCKEPLCGCPPCGILIRHGAPLYGKLIRHS